MVYVCVWRREREKKSCATSVTASSISLLVRGQAWETVLGSRLVYREKERVEETHAKGHISEIFPSSWRPGAEHTQLDLIAHRNGEGGYIPRRGSFIHNIVTDISFAFLSLSPFPPFLPLASFVNWKKRHVKTWSITVSMTNC